MSTERLPQVALQEQPCHLLRLPPELRLKIYRYLFKHGHIWFGHRPFKYSFPDYCALQTCRLVHREASDVLYRENTFKFGCSYSNTPHVKLLNFLFNLRIHRLELVVYLQIAKVNARYLKDIVSTFGSGREVKDLTVVYDSIGCTSAQVDKYMASFKDVKVRGDITIKPYRVERSAMIMSEAAKAKLIESMRRKCTAVPMCAVY